MSSIRIERLAFAYSDRVPLLSDVELHLTRGFTGVVGANGSGKSTLLGLIAGALTPTAGRIHREPRDALVALCPQDVDHIPPDAIELAERGDADAGRWRAVLALDPDQLARWPTLSPGERRRWQLGGALARGPDLLLLDEPTNHVDPSCRALLLGALHRFDGIAVVISHDRAVLDELTFATIRVHGGTARTGPWLIASLPERMAVRMESATRTTTNENRSSTGKCISIPQLKDCRLMTNTSTRLIAAPAARPASAPSAASSPPSAASIAAICRRVRPRWRSMPNSRRRASTTAPRLEERPNSPTSTATASIA